MPDTSQINVFSFLTVVSVIFTGHYNYRLQTVCMFYTYDMVSADRLYKQESYIKYTNYLPVWEPSERVPITCFSTGALLISRWVLKLYISALKPYKCSETKCKEQPLSTNKLNPVLDSMTPPPIPSLDGWMSSQM